MMMNDDDSQVDEDLHEDEVEVREEENENHAELEYLAGAGTEDRAEKDEDEDEDKDKDKDVEEEEYSRRVNRRVGKLTAKYREEERARLAESARADALQARLEELEEKRAKAADDHYESSEKSIKERIKLATEDENWAEVMKGNDELRELDKGRIAQISKPEKAAPQNKPTGDGVNLAPNAKKWLEDNGDWFDADSPDYDEALAARAIRWSKKLQKDELFDINDPQLYETINEKLGLNKEGGEEEEEPAKFVDRGRRSTNTGSRGPRRNKPKGKTLTAHDKNLMRVFMLNPNSKTDQAEWIKRRNG